MNDVPRAIGQYTGDYDDLVPNDNTVAIHCGEGHLTRISNTREGFDQIVDKRFPEIGWEVPSGSNPCTPVTTAYRYDTDDLTGPHSVIVLCDGAAPATLSATRVIGDNWNGKWRGEDYDTFGGYTSSTLVHEFMHAIRKGISHTLPSGRAETYAFDEIKALSDEDKIKNAQGYSLLATGMWLRYNTMGADGAMGRRFSRNNRPGRGPHMYPK